MPSFHKSSKIFILGFFLNLLFVSCSPSSDKAEQSNAGNDLPDLSITTLQGVQLALKKNQGKAIVIMFQPECDDCQREAVQIRDHIDSFKGYMVYFISSAPIPQIAEFAKHFQLLEYDHVVFAQTTVQNVLNTLGPISAPSLYIYSEEGKLVKAFNKEVKFDDIKTYL